MGRDGSGTSGSFLDKLVEILSDESNSPYICWQPSGRSFLIHDVTEFEVNVLTKYFKHSNHNSFVRQLNMYNFVKTCNDANFREFHNPNFQRDRPELMANIKRKASQPANASVALEKKPDVQNMTQRQKAMLEQQERENERLEQAKQRRAAAQAAAQVTSQHPSQLNVPSPGAPGAGAGAGGVTWDKNLGLGGTDLLAMGSPFDYQGNDSPFASVFRLNSHESASGEPLLLPGRRNPEGINGADDAFAFSRLNSLDPNNGPRIGRARSNSGSSQTSRGGRARSMAAEMLTGAVTASQQDAVNRIRELETRNFLLTERFNELRSQSRTVMLLLHGFLNDIVDAENLRSGNGSPIAKVRTDKDKGSPRESDADGGESFARVTRAVSSSAATALKELSPLVYQLSGGAGSLTVNTTSTGANKDEESEREHSPAARALRVAGGSSADLTGDIADRNTQDAVDLIKSMRTADAKTNEGASNFVSLISSINSSAKKEKVSGSLAGEPIVKLPSLPASFAPPPQPQTSPKNTSSVDGNTAPSGGGRGSGAAGEDKPASVAGVTSSSGTGNTVAGNITGVKRELEVGKVGEALAGLPLRKVATVIK